MIKYHIRYNSGIEETRTFVSNIEFVKFLQNNAINIDSTSRLIDEQYHPIDLHDGWLNLQG